MNFLEHGVLSLWAPAQVPDKLSLLQSPRSWACFPGSLASLMSTGSLASPVVCLLINHSWAQENLLSTQISSCLSPPTLGTLCFLFNPGVLCSIEFSLGIFCTSVRINLALFWRSCAFLFPHYCPSDDALSRCLHGMISLGVLIQDLQGAGQWHRGAKWTQCDPIGWGNDCVLLWAILKFKQSLSHKNSAQ